MTHYHTVFANPIQVKNQHIGNFKDRCLQSTHFSADIHMILDGGGEFCLFSGTSRNVTNRLSPLPYQWIQDKVTKSMIFLNATLIF